MNDETQAILQRAYALIEVGNLDEARAVLAPVLESEPDNADAWWLYAHAVTDVNEGQRALENVLRIDPDYPGAEALVEAARQQADEQTPPHPEIKPLAPPPSIPEAPPEIPEMYDPAPEVTPPPAEPSMASLTTDAPPTAAPPPPPQTEQPREQRRSLVMPIIAALIIVALVVVAVIVLLQQPTADPAVLTQTAVSAVDTLAATSTDEDVAVLATETEEVEATPTESTTPTLEALIDPSETATLEVIALITPEVEDTGEPTPVAEAVEETPEATIEVDPLIEALAPFTLAEAGVETVETDLGDTLTASVCAEPGRQVRQLTPEVLNALAAVSDALDAEALAVRFVNCAEDDTELVAVGVDIEIARAYAAGNLNDGEFSQNWQPLEF